MSIPGAAAATPSAVAKTTVGAGARGKAREVLAVAVAGALLTSAIYLGVAGFEHYVQNRFIPVSRDATWMSPLAHLFFFVVPALPLALLARRLARATAVRAATILTAWLIVFAIFLPWTEIHRLAAALLAAGVAVALGRLAARSPDRWLLGVRRLRLVALVLLVVTACVVQGWRTWTRRRDYAALPPAPAGDAPNVLLIILDTVRAEDLGLYGYARNTSPNIDAFARRGVVFDHATSASPWTLPSHASMFTGQYAGRLSTNFDTPLDRRYPTLAEAFRSRGYETAGFIANQHYTAWDSGLSRGFLTYYDFPRSLVQLLKSCWYGQTMMLNELYQAQTSEDVTRTLRAFKVYVAPKPEGDPNRAEDITDRFLAWQERRASRPYFAFLNYYDAHNPYKPPLELRRKFSASPKSHDLYDAEIFHMDLELGRLFETLEKRGALRNTLVVIAADHGEQFGEHKLFGHGNSVYLPLLHVPLVMVFDGRLPAGRRVSQTVSLRDLARTIEDVAGFDSGLPGASLAGHWRAGAGAGADSSVIGSPALAELFRNKGDTTTTGWARSRQYALVDDQWHYLWRITGQRELYAYRSDPKETANQVEGADGKAIAERMHARATAIVAGDTASAAVLARVSSRARGRGEQ